nr:hypothetical protein GCM10020093_014770 [Planobispora longispora]
MGRLCGRADTGSESLPILVPAAPGKRVACRSAWGGDRDPARRPPRRRTGSRRGARDATADAGIAAGTGTPADARPAARAGTPAGSRSGARRTELAAFLRSRRERVTPADVGLPPGLRRRTPGLRREEVAQLAGVGITWYTWLEQGRPINVSVQVLDAISRTLGLDPAEHEHLYRLADVPEVTETGAAAPWNPRRSSSSTSSTRSPPRSTTPATTSWPGTTPTSGCSPT